MQLRRGRQLRQRAELQLRREVSNVVQRRRVRHRRRPADKNAALWGAHLRRAKGQFLSRAVGVLWRSTDVTFPRFRVADGNDTRVHDLNAPYFRVEIINRVGKSEGKKEDFLRTWNV